MLECMRRECSCARVHAQGVQLCARVHVQGVQLCARVHGAGQGSLVLPHCNAAM